MMKSKINLQDVSFKSQTLACMREYEIKDEVKAWGLGISRRNELQRLQDEDFASQ
jgi:hypothetical protein